MRRTLVSRPPSALGRVRGRRRRYRTFLVKVESALQEGLDLGLAEAAVSARRAYAADASSRCPPGHRLRVYPEQRGHFAGCQQAISRVHA
jgi:hypothetical protein